MACSRSQQPAVRGGAAGSRQPAAVMGKKDRAGKGKVKGKARREAQAAASQNKKGDRQARKQLQKQALRKGKQYTQSDLQEFREALNASGMQLREMQGDGNCFFRAVSDQLDGTPNSHGVCRDLTCALMCACYCCCCCCCCCHTAPRRGELLLALPTPCCAQARP